MTPGIVMLSTGSWYKVRLNTGEVVDARLKGKLRLKNDKSTNPVAVGDEVGMEFDDQDMLISEIRQRKNYIIRKSNNLSKQTQVIASNIDQVLVMATVALPRTSTGFIDRILLTAEAYHIPATIVLNKSDLSALDPSLDSVAREYRSIYEKAGYAVLDVSVHEKKNLDKITELLGHRKTLITGHSGVGKSSFLNFLNPALKRKTSEISTYSLKGKHTTTFAEMFEISRDTFVIDTPGIKDFGVVEIEPREISHYFREMKEYVSNCRFSNCLHINEPGCAVLAAVESGAIHPERYYNYLSILRNDDTHHQ